MSSLATPLGLVACLDDPDSVCRAGPGPGCFGTLRCNFLLGYSTNSGDWDQDGTGRACDRRAATGAGSIHAIDSDRCRAGTRRVVRVNAANDQFVVWCDSNGHHHICFSFDRSFACRVSRMSHSRETGDESRSRSFAKIRIVRLDDKTRFTRSTREGLGSVGAKCL